MLEQIKAKVPRPPLYILCLFQERNHILYGPWKKRTLADFGGVDGDFYQYSVSLAYEDDRTVEGKGIGRKVLDKLHQTYDSELGGKDFAYDGEKTLFTVGPLPGNKLEFTVVLEDITSNRAAGNGSPGGSGSPNETDRKRLRRPYQSKSFKVAISFATKIPMRSIVIALRGQESEHFQEAVRVLDIILRQNAAKQGCLLVKQSYFHNNPWNFCDLGGGVTGCRGFHSSFRATQGGLSLNMDVSTTMIVRPGPVFQFLLDNQGVRDPYQIDWLKSQEIGLVAHQNDQDSEEIKSKVSQEMFDSIIREVLEEIGVPASCLSDPIFIGISRRELNVRPAAFFFIKCSLDSKEVQQLYSKAQDSYESVQIYAVSREELQKIASKMPGCHRGGWALYELMMEERLGN